MDDKEIQSLINILQEAKGSSESFKKGRLMDCYNDLKWMIQDDLDSIEKRKAKNLIEDVEDAITAYNEFAKANRLQSMTYNTVIESKYELT